MTRQEEAELIRRAIAGDRDAAGAFIRAHQAPLFAYMLRLSGRPEVAEDVVQEAFVRALTNLDRFDFRFRFSTWLFTIAKRLYVNARQKLAPAFDTDTVAGVQGRPSLPEGPAEDDESRSNARTAIDHALAVLSDDQREIIVLFHQLDWPIALIAQYLDMPEGTVKSHLHRGRQKMRAVLEADESFADTLQEVLG